MLSRRRCPHTGVVNFYFVDEPHLAVGSVVKAGRSGYLWRCYADPCAGVGSEVDAQAAEKRVAELCAQALARQHTALGRAA
jgi:hypothetical protein